MIAAALCIGAVVAPGPGRAGLFGEVDVWAEAGSELEVWSAQQKSDLLSEMCGGPIQFRLHVTR